jgi:hypothetical protein
MSFHVEFVAASAEDAVAIVQAEKQLPDCVKDFIVKALDGCKGSPVSIHATGHLYTGAGSYDISNANLVVKKVALRMAEPPAKAPITD